MPKNLKKLRIFAASPSDVASERAKLETVVDSLKPIADYLGLTLEVVDWRAVVPDAGRPQQIIFDQLKPTSWDVFIGILWHRFGTPPGATDKTGKEYLSGTEEEFKTAYEFWKQHGKPRIVLYRCTRALPFDVDPDQLKRVREFFKIVEDVKGDYPTLYQAFDTAESFEKLLLDNLQKLLIEYGEQSKTPITAEIAQIIGTNIPNRVSIPRRTAFFGRTKEMDSVMRALSPIDRTWGVLIDGIGGIGKSALAIEAAHRALNAGIFDAIVFVTAKQNILTPNGIREQAPAAQTLDEFLNETARVLWQPGIPKLASDEKRRVLLDVLRTMRALLIYDNLETLSKEEQEAVADFLRELPQGCKAIITSRRRGGEGAVWLRVEKLDLDAAHSIIENEIARDGGLANKLLRFEARWQELYYETNGSPLALVHILGLMRVRASLAFDSALAMLQGNHDSDLQNFVFQEANKELTENDKAALGSLSFFTPSATFDAWMQVARLSRNALETTIDRLSALSLVDVLAGEERYALHPLTRAFVRNELLIDANVAHEMGMRFAQYWLDYAIQYTVGYKGYQTFDRLEEQWSNLEAAVTWILQAIDEYGLALEAVKESDMALQFARRLARFMEYSGRWEEFIQLGSHTYEIASTIGDRKQAGWQAYRVAWILFKQGSTENASLWMQKCVKEWEQVDSKYEQAVAQGLQGLVAMQSKNYEDAEQFFQNTLSIYKELERNKDVTIVLNDLGELARAREDYRAAESYYTEALDLAMKQGLNVQIAYLSGNLGFAAISLERWDEAYQWFEQSLSFAQGVGRLDLVADAQYGLARVDEAKGHADLALPLAQSALKIYERLHHMDLAAARELVERLLK
ncbi:MAG: tetratricopeptide repeat protein [Anaerolineales bacterium]|nr:tetratricopeptide repeat protein [Anaerolineales bacterium]